MVVEKNGNGSQALQTVERQAVRRFAFAEATVPIKSGEAVRRLTMMVMTILICFVAIVEAQVDTDASPDVIWIGLEHGSEAEAGMASELRALVSKYDIEPWILTRRILIDENELPHSHPILTIHTRHIGDELGLLATFVHEQLHWLEEEPWNADFRAATEELERLFTDVPSAAGGGARDERSTYRHLLVCDMEYQAVSALVGEAAAREAIAGHTHYEWIYDKVLNDSRVRDVALRHGLDVSAGVPGLQQKRLDQ